jgi:hypothetical protein
MKKSLTIAARVLVGVLLMLLVLNSPRLLDKAAGELTGWDDKTKQMYVNEVAINDQYVEMAKQREAQSLSSTER